MQLPEKMSADVQQSGSALKGSDTTVRPTSLEIHPVSQRNYHCPTVMLDELAASAATWIDAGVERVVIVAPPGFGKTYAMRCISRHLVLQHPEVGFARIQATPSNDSGLSVGTFTTFSRDGEPAASTALDGSNTLQEYLQEFSNRTGQRSIVLWVDDAHLLTTPADDTLRMVKDELENVEIRLTVLLVGLASVRRLHEKRVSFSGDITRIIPSLHVEEFELRGLRSAIDIEHSLDGFDKTCFPSGSNWSFTRFFLPQAYQNGLRLYKHAAVLWRVFVAEDRDRDGRPATEVPIVCFLRAVECALISGAGRDCADLRVDEEFWRGAVLKSGWVERQEFQRSVRILYGPEDPY